MAIGDDATTRALIKWGEDAQCVADRIDELLAGDGTAVVPHVFRVNPLLKWCMYGMAAALWLLYRQRDQPVRLHVDDPSAFLEALHTRDPTAPMPPSAHTAWSAAELLRRPIVIRCSAQTELDDVLTPAHASEIPLIIWTCPAPVDA